MMITRSSVKRLGLALPILMLGFGAGSVSAATIGGIPIDASLFFTFPNGTVAPTDSIPLIVTLSLASDSVALTTDGSGNVIGLTVADIAPYFNGTAGVDLNNDTLSAIVNEDYGCSDFNSAACLAGPPYDFAFNYTAPSLTTPLNLDVEPGDSFTYLFGTYSPTGGVAAPGTYTESFVAVDLEVFDDSVGGAEIALIDIADTSNQPSFTRTVASSTPEPGTWTLMLAGLAMAGCAAIRSRRRRAG